VIAIAFEDESSTKWTTLYQGSGQSFVGYYFRSLIENKENFDYLTDELENLIAAHEALANSADTKAYRILLDFTRQIAPFLKQRAYLLVLLDFCRAAIVATESTNINPGWIYLLEYEAHYALGNWSAATADIQLSIKTSLGNDASVYAQAILSLGRLQLNQGNYQEALETLSQAEQLLSDLNDFEGLATTKAEQAAYYLNRGELDKAMEFYLEADRIYRLSGANASSDHTLLMLGVVYRRKQNYAMAKQYLQELLGHGKSQKNDSAIATASHHLAWVYLNQENLIQAKAFAEEAKRLYQKIRDPRGESDADEQLGLISLAEGDTNNAHEYVKRSLSVRRMLGNRHGEASCLRRLALIHFKSGNLLSGILYPTFRTCG
jgi:tetratricopeptide (TPR) repeat protein